MFGCPLVPFSPPPPPPFRCPAGGCTRRPPACLRIRRGSAPCPTSCLGPTGKPGRCPVCEEDACKRSTAGRGPLAATIHREGCMRDGAASGWCAWRAVQVPCRPLPTCTSTHGCIATPSTCTHPPCRCAQGPPLAGVGGGPRPRPPSGRHLGSPPTALQHPRSGGTPEAGAARWWGWGGAGARRRGMS